MISYTERRAAAVVDMIDTAIARIEISTPKELEHTASMLRRIDWMDDTEPAYRVLAAVHDMVKVLLFQKTEAERQKLEESEEG